MTSETKYPPIRLAQNGGGEFPLQLAAFAYDSEDRAMLVSAVGSSASVKAFKAVLQDRTIPCSVRTQIPGNYSEKSCTKCDCGYDVDCWRISGPWWHMVAISKDPRFMPYYDEAALWQRINSNAFTTPVIQEWGPHILETLLKVDVRLDGTYRQTAKALAKCTSYNCNAAMLYATDEYLDSIVSMGLKQSKIQIPE